MPSDYPIFALYLSAVECVDEGGTYEAEAGQDQRVLEVSDMVRRGDGQIGFASATVAIMT